MANQASIEIDGISKNYGYVHALRDITLEVLHGEVIGILGPNGSGKTTLLKVLATLISPNSGNVREYGLDPKKKGKEVRRMIGYLAYEPLLYREFTGEENIRFYSKFYQPSLRENLQKRLDETLNLLKITRWRHEPVKNLSSGLRKRFDFARAIIHEPRIILLDEPFSGLDIESANILQGFIRDARKNRTVVVSTHKIDWAKRLCDKVVILVSGKVCQVISGPEITDENVKKVFERGVSY